jgi:serine phosphatase RsbU (regulator of sigma subunit)/HAMP domain-containing protein
MRLTPRVCHEVHLMLYRVPIRSKLLLVFCLVVLPLVGITAISAQRQWQQRHESLLDSHQEMAAAMADAILAFLQNFADTQEAMGIATRRDIRDPRAFHDYIADVARANSYLLGYAVIRRDGSLCYSDQPSPWWRTLGDRSDVTVVGAGCQWGVSNLQRTVDGKPVVTIATPLPESSRLLRAAIDVSALKKLLHLSLRPGWRVVIVDAAGRLVYHSSLEAERAWAKQDWQNHPGVREARRLGQSHLESYRSLADGQWCLGSYKRVDPIGWVVGSGCPTEQAMAPVRAALATDCWQIAVAVAATLLLTLVLGARLSRPIERLAAAAASLGRGEVEVVVPVEGQDELAVLARAFNTMGAQIREREERLRTALLAEQAAERYQTQLRRQAEAERAFTEAILEHAPVGIAVLEPAGLTACQANARLLTYLEEPFRSQGVSGAPLAAFLPRAEELGLLAHARHVAAIGGSLVLPDFEFHGFARGVVYWNLSITSMRGWDGEVTGLVLLIDEATDQVLHRRAVEAALEREHTIASTLQRAFLPRSLPECPGYTFGAGYHPALREAQVGGDFYDVFPLPDGRFGLLLGDVSGKGVTAAVYATMTRYLVRAYALQMASPGEVMARVNRALCVSIEDPELFVTGFYAVLDPEADTLCYANAGHWPALLSRAQGTELLGGHGLALGIMPEAAYREGCLPLEPGDEILLYTDGLVEIHGDDPISRLEALQETLGRRDESPARLVEGLYREVSRKGSGTMRDDIALLAIRCEKAPRRPSSGAAGRLGRSEHDRGHA